MCKSFYYFLEQFHEAAAGDDFFAPFADLPDIDFNTAHVSSDGRR